MQSIEFFFYSKVFLPIVVMILVELVLKRAFLGVYTSVVIGHKSRIAGILLMLITYFLLIIEGDISLNSLREGYTFHISNLIWIIPLVIVTRLFANLINHKNAIAQRDFGTIDNDKKWEYLLVWFCYLLMYELFFRKFLFPYESLGLVTAIVINLFFYVVAHLHHGKEAIAAIPYGIIICMVTAFTGNLWAAFLSHMMLVYTIQFNGRGLFVIRTDKIFKFKISKS